ncbi:MAG: TetR/AcrR family transcriptional regulator [Actinomycetaceae bacterium]|nr:TetR/AcrR family transcriptional regulator [Actinomycetaceae bacterium]
MTLQLAKRKRENTVRILIAASAEVFADKGVAGATVDDLVVAAGFTRGAFYSNFSSKEEVFSAALQKFTEDLVDAMQSGIEESAPESTPQDSVRSILESIRPLGRVWVLLEAEGVRQALLDEQVKTVYLESRDYLQRALISTLQEATDTPLADFPADMLPHLAAMLLNAYSDALIRELLTGEDSTERLVELVDQILFQEAPRPGQAPAD